MPVLTRSKKNKTPLQSLPYPLPRQQSLRRQRSLPRPQLLPPPQLQLQSQSQSQSQSLSRTPDAVLEPVTGDDIQSIIYTRDLSILQKLESYFKNKYRTGSLNWRSDYSVEEQRLQVCCTPNERVKILSFAYMIKNIPAYQHLRLVDIFIVLIYTYYSLAYNEQTRRWLSFPTLIRLVNNVDENGNMLLPDGISSGNSSYAIGLYFDITTKDIMVNMPNGQPINVSSEIRRTMLDIVGGKKTKTMRRKRKIRK